jgi:hypothetical protein
VRVKCDGIISKARVIKDQAQMIEHAIVPGKTIDDMGVENKEKTSNVEPYQHPH